MEYIELTLTACIKKKKIRTVELAEKISKKFNQYYYFCPICNNYHMTRSETSQGRVIIKNKAGAV